MCSECSKTVGSIGQLDQSGRRAGTASLVEGMVPSCQLEPYVDAKEGAAFLRLHPKTLMRLAREGVVRAYSFSDGVRHHWRFLLSELDTWMRSKVNSNAHPVRPCPANGRRK